MSSSVIGSLRVNLGLDSANFQRGARRVEQPLQRMQRQFKAVTAAAAAMGVGITAAAAAGAKQIDETAKAARRLDASIGGFRALELAASEAGVSLSSLTNDIQTMNREIANIGTSGNGQRALDALGISLQEIENLDADEKLAIISDRANELGLSAGEITAVLRDLGVRNREMALLVLQGGDAIRSARGDIEDYGLAISEVDANRIEAANDAISRLGLISQYAGQQLALAVIPAMGALASAMTDSLREGGLLRTAIDALAGSVDVLAYSAGVAVAAFGARYVGAIIASKVATFSLVGALAALRAAIISTGIGVLIVGAGYLIAKFVDLVSAAGSVGQAFSLMRDVAAEVFRRMGLGATGFLNLSRAAALGVGAAFLSAFKSIAAAWDSLINGMAAGWNTLAQSRVGSTLGLGVMGDSDAADRIGARAEDMLSRGTDAARQASEQLAAARAPIESLEALRDTMASTGEAAESASGEVIDLSGGVEELEGAASGGAGGLAQIDVEAENLSDTLSNDLKSSVSEMVDAFSDWFSRGFNDFQSMADSIKNSFRSLLADLAQAAIANPIQVALGVGAGGAGVLGGALGGLGGLASSFGGGLSASLGGLMTGGLSGGLSAITGGLSAGGLSGIASAAGAALPFIAAGAAVVSFFRTSEETIDAGIQATVTMQNAAFQSFEEIEKSRFWGLSKSKSTRISALSNAQSSPLTAAIDEMRTGALQAASELGLSDKILKGFRSQFQVSLAGLSDTEQQAAIADALEDVGDDMAATILGWNLGTALSGLSDRTAGAYDELIRLSSSLTTVNDAFQDLGLKAFNLSLGGGRAAASFVDLFGSLENFTSASAEYYDRFFSDEEKLVNATTRVSDALSDLGINVMPDTNDAFRELVETARSAGDLDLVAELIQLAPAFDSVTDAAAALNSEVSSLASVIEDDFATGLDYRRGLALAENGIAYTAETSPAQMAAELRALRAQVALQQSTLEITAANTGKSADNTESQLLLAEEGIL